VPSGRICGSFFGGTLFGNTAAFGSTSLPFTPNSAS
jgi:hypothetical protein